MKGKSLLVWLAVLALALGGWFFSQNRQESQEKTTAAESRLLNLGEPSAMLSLEIGGGEQPQVIRLERPSPDKPWQITQPLAWPADTVLAGRMVSELLAAQVKERHPAAGRLADFGLEPPRLRLVLQEKGGAKAEALVGDLSPSKEFVYAALPGSDQVLFLPGALRPALAKTLFELRAKEALEVAVGQVRGVRLKLAERELKLDKAGEEAPWLLEGKDEADPRAVDDLLYQARGLITTSFQDVGLNLERMGLAKPWGQLKLSLAGGGETGLLLGGPVPGAQERYARRLEGGPVMTLKQESLERLSRAPKDLLERRLLRFSRDQVQALSIARGADELVYEKREGRLTRVKPAGADKEGEDISLFLWDLLELKWEEAAKSGPPLEQSGAVIKVTVGGPDAQPRETILTLGPLEGEGLLPARLSGDPRAFMVSRAFVAKMPGNTGDFPAKQK